MQPPTQQRAFIAPDGTAKALFADASLLLLSSNGCSFTFVSADGARTTQLTACCLSRLRPAVRQLLALRNSLADVPVVPPWLHAEQQAQQQAQQQQAQQQQAQQQQAQQQQQQQQQGVAGTTTTGVPTTALAWPASPAAALEAGLVELRDAQRVALRSACGAGTLELDCSGLRFHVTYPLLVAVRGRSFVYVQHTQVFSRSSCPPRWQHALSVAAALADCAAAGFEPGWQQQPPQPGVAAPHRGARSPGSSAGSPVRHGSPLQRQHRAWRDDAKAQQQQPLSCEAAEAAAAEQHVITQLPVPDELVPLLPPWSPQQQQQQQQQLGQASSHVAAALAQVLGQQQQEGTGSWWLEPSLLLPQDELLQLQWTHDATMLFVQDVEEVEVWLHADGSNLYTFQGGAFITHVLPCCAAWDARGAAAAAGPAGAAGTAPPLGPLARAAAQLAAGDDGLLEQRLDASELSRVYAASALPDGLLGRVAAEALKFRSAMVRVKRCRKAAAAAAAAAAQPPPAPLPGCGLLALPAAPGFASSLAQPRAHSRQPQLQPQGQAAAQDQQLSMQVSEEQEVPGLGRFVAYADGRVRACFEDRTLLTLAADRGSASLLLPDGSRRLVAASNPVGVEQYVQPALEFAAWASTSPVERAAALRTQALIAAELRSSARMAAICASGASPARLAPAPAACGRGSAAAADVLDDAWASMGLADGSGLEDAAEPQEPPQLAPASALAAPGAARHAAVEALLAANARLLARLP